MNRITRYFLCKRIMRLGEAALEAEDMGDIARADELFEQARNLERSYEQRHQHRRTETASVHEDASG